MRLFSQSNRYQEREKEKAEKEKAEKAKAEAGHGWTDYYSYQPSSLNIAFLGSFHQQVSNRLVDRLFLGSCEPFLAASPSSRGHGSIASATHSVESISVCGLNN